MLFDFDILMGNDGVNFFVIEVVWEFNEILAYFGGGYILVEQVFQDIYGVLFFEIMEKWMLKFVNMVNLVFI